MPDTTLTSAELTESLLIHLHGCLSRVDKDGIIRVPATYITGAIEALARAGLEAGKAEESMQESYLVWSNEHHAWWRPNSRGYAKSIEDAGVYSREEAMDIAGTSRNGWTVDHTPDEIPVAVADIPERMRTAIRALPLTGGDNGSQQS